MELLTVISGVAVLVLAYALWVWWRDGRTWQPFCGRIRLRMHSALGVVSREEMEVVQKNFEAKEQQWETRITRLEATTKFSNHLQYVSSGLERRLTKLELSERPTSLWGKQVEPPRSLVRLGVRVTLSDAFWENLGTQRVEQIEDQLIDHLIQGPFCPFCLKRCVRRDRARHSAEIPVQCRHCGTSWDGQGTSYPISTIELKRKVYEQLDQEYRAGGTPESIEHG